MKKNYYLTKNDKITEDSDINNNSSFTNIVFAVQRNMSLTLSKNVIPIIAFIEMIPF